MLVHFTCLQIICKYYGENIRLQTLRSLCEINKVGVSILGISDAAEKIGFRTLASRIDLGGYSPRPFAACTDLVVCKPDPLAAALASVIFTTG
jgi:ABC-type bacteriocin/lantibiotic exporter with double-glycine peptidase domain